MTTADAIVDALLTESFVGWHSSPNSFRRFNTDREGAHFGTREQAENLRKPGKKAAKPYVVDIKNPLRVRDMGTWTLDGIATELLMQDVITQADYDAIREEFLWTDERGFAKLKAVLAALGYDGFVYDNEQEGQGDSYVAFYSKQIKPYRVAESLDDNDVAKDFASDVPHSGFVLVYQPTHPNGQVLYYAGRPEVLAQDVKDFTAWTPELTKACFFYHLEDAQRKLEIYELPYTEEGGYLISRVKTPGKPGRYESMDDFDPKEFAMQPSVIYRHPVWDVTPQAIRDFFRAKGFQVRQVRRRTRGALVVMLRKDPPPTDYKEIEALEWETRRWLEKVTGKGPNHTPFEVRVVWLSSDVSSVEIEIFKMEHGNPKRYGEGPHPYA